MAGGSFAVPADPAAAQLTAPPQVARGRSYNLPQLIDLAQRNNPATRIAWEQARQAALSVGEAEAAFLPMISANVIGGSQDIVTPLPNPSGGTSYVSTNASGVMPQLALQWLVFDFGERKALRTAAQHNSYAANALFNGTHQALIYNVTRTYYEYGAAVTNAGIARQSLANSQNIQAAATARMNNGTGTTIDVAQANQLVAESKFRLVQAQNRQRDAYQALLGAMGISPLTRISIADSSGRPLPRASAQLSEQAIRNALSRRPDVIASYSALKASEAGILAAEAGFRPKVYAGAVASSNKTSLQTGGLPGIDLQGAGTGVVVGVTVPVYSGGIRKSQFKRAQSAAAAAQATLQQTQDAALREIVVASDSLNSSLEAYAAASALTEAAAITYDASIDAYRNGIGTVTDMEAAGNGLLDAKQARADAHAASLISAATLAFALGSMTRSP